MAPKKRKASAEQGTTADKRRRASKKDSACKGEPRPPLPKNSDDDEPRRQQLARALDWAVANLEASLLRAVARELVMGVRLKDARPVAAEALLNARSNLLLRRTDELHAALERAWKDADTNQEKRKASAARKKLVSEINLANRAVWDWVESWPQRAPPGSTGADNGAVEAADRQQLAALLARRVADEDAAEAALRPSSHSPGPVSQKNNTTTTSSNSGSTTTSSASGENTSRGVTRCLGALAALQTRRHLVPISGPGARQQGENTDADPVAYVRLHWQMPMCETSSAFVSVPVRLCRFKPVVSSADDVYDGPTRPDRRTHLTATVLCATNLADAFRAAAEAGVAPSGDGQSPFAAALGARLLSASRRTGSREDEVNEMKALPARLYFSVLRPTFRDGPADLNIGAIEGCWTSVCVRAGFSYWLDLPAALRAHLTRTCAARRVGGLTESLFALIFDYGIGHHSSTTQHSFSARFPLSSLFGNSLHAPI